MGFLLRQPWQTWGILGRNGELINQLTSLTWLHRLSLSLKQDRGKFVLTWNMLRKRNSNTGLNKSAITARKRLKNKKLPFQIIIEQHRYLHKWTWTCRAMPEKGSFPVCNMDYKWKNSGYWLGHHYFFTRHRKKAKRWTPNWLCVLLLRLGR